MWLGDEEAWKEERTTDGRTDEWMGGWMDGQMLVRQMDRRVDSCMAGINQRGKVTKVTLTLVKS